MLKKILKKIKIFTINKYVVATCKGRKPADSK